MADLLEEGKIEEYRAAVITCALVRQLLRHHDIPGLLRAIEHSHAVGPILDPTLYRDRVQAMEEDRALLEAALKLRDFEPGARRG